ncbi:hypothetical protein ACFWCB_05520 [Streptomyces sp. NPDC060048]|uniref:hypothetical protein n=1 Tax=unclassified Streptomyces TaxID=2593676 RepID=UPI00368269BE
MRDAKRTSLLAARAPEDDQDDAASVSGLTLQDFRRTGPALTFGQLDEVFLTAWKAHMRATPARLAATLLDGVDGARATVTLYPDGGGSIDVRVEPRGVLQALLQLRLPSGGEELVVDEIRIAESARHSVLFQRLMFRADEVARLLGVRSVTLTATDVGRYALLTLGRRPSDRYRGSEGASGE